MQKKSKSRNCHSWSNAGHRKSCPIEEQKGGKIPHLLLRENLQEAEAHFVAQMSGLLAGKQTASAGIVV